ncbi:unnamed protein product [Prunus armeniaca]
MMIVHVDLTSLKVIVAETGIVLDCQVHDLSYKVADGGVGNDGQWIWMVLQHLVGLRRVDEKVIGDGAPVP